MIKEKENVNEILYFNEGNLIPKHDSVINTFLRYTIFFITIIGIILLLYDVSILEMSLSAKIAYFSVLGYMLKVRGNVRILQPTEI